MKIADSAKVHPTAILSDEIEIGENAQIGPYAIVEGKVRIAADCVLEPRVHLIGELTLGGGCRVGTGTVLGARPQHLHYDGAVHRVAIGERNVFREYVTVHGSFVDGGVTTIGDRNYFMVNSHVGHDCLIGNDCLFVNGSLVAGHAIIQDRAIMSGHAAIHQFGAVGKLALLSGSATATKDVPPYCIVYDRNLFGGANVVGMRRAGYPPASINAVRKAYRTIYHSGLPLKQALAVVEQELGQHDVVKDILEFARSSKRGIPGGHFNVKSHAESEAA